MDTTPVLGIDMGFSKCMVGIVSSTGIRMARSKHGNSMIPAYVGRERGKFVVGENAQMVAEWKPKSVAFGITRLLGNRSHLTEDGNYPFKLTNDERTGRLKIILNDGNKEEEYPVVMLVGQLIRYLATIGNSLLAEPTRNVVVTVPCGASKEVIEDLKQSVKHADLELIALISEPEAVVTTYAHEFRGLTKTTTRQIAVVDFGSSSLDLSHISLSESGISVVKAQRHSDVRGSIFDERIVEYFLDEASEYVTTEALYDDVLVKVRQQCEEAKIALSDDDSTSIPISCIDSDYEDERIELTREQFRTMCSDILEKCTKYIREFMSVSQPSEVLLVGGMCCSPLIQSCIADGCVCNCECRLDKYETCATGAAIHGCNVLRAVQEPAAPHVEDQHQQTVTHEAVDEIKQDQQQTQNILEEPHDIDEKESGLCGCCLLM